MTDDYEKVLGCFVCGQTGHEKYTFGRKNDFLDLILKNLKKSKVSAVRSLYSKINVSLFKM
jgi:hypothetical protein